MQRPESDPFVTVMREDDMEDCGEHDYNPYSEENLEQARQFRQACGVTEEDDKRQCAEMIQMQRYYWKCKRLEAEAQRIRYETGYWPDWIDHIYDEDFDYTSEKR